MPSFPTRPLVRPRDDGLQLSYQLPHRAHAAKGYPVLAPNGSSIIIYGYENGLKVIWRGGRQFSAEKTTTQEDKPKEKANGGHDDAVMIIDSDEEDSPEPPIDEVLRYSFNSEEPEVDPTYPFEDVLRQIDIPLGSKVLELAVPCILPDTARSPLDPFPPILKKTIVVSAVCADYSTRVVALPLTPPHPTQTDPSTWQIQSLLIAGAHQEIPRGVSITFTCQEGEEDRELSKSRGRSTTHNLDTSNAERWDLLVATHSAEASGLLLFHRIPIVDESNGNEGIYSLSEVLEAKRRHLPAPAKTIAFNPSSYPSTRHSTLLVAFHSGCVKIYSCFSTRPSKVSRRSSGPQSDFETTETEGKWLISLYPGFDQTASGLAHRKTIIDSKWVLGGRAVMVLMADGEWGVWDIEGAGPGTVKGPLHRQSSVQGVTGGSLTAFSVSGRILSPLTGNNKPELASVEQRPKFAPMTPSTKRVREDTLLKGSMGLSRPSMCGELSVFQINSSRDVLPDESILLRHGDQSAVIPSLLSLWRNAVKASGTFDASNRCRVSTIQDVNLMGENFTGIGHLPAAARRTRDTERRDFDILVTTEHRVMILAPRLTEPEEQPAFRQSVNEAPTAETDQLMLRRGELDVDGMDRLLSGMANGNQSLRMGSPIKRARIFT
ncbi:hypothetical protein ASPWEDRAFT_112616 [Aspergillus wentii DTO 134E9]|uniref:Nucleoporin NUP37 n=1 Tax=Aspergillus wentii DTO 134E9 TaxID=1073089 RepID=A0A1L9RH40_ASPWE|nr:uncharacterized protein ASPWEDRAFT_112616 [Aspergillus wentii DTO 134E9]OJJ34251.1 hypothetical protein ASPWEDRAFT_112616 [Aspergillus wentii DTO 134E9]